MNRFASMRSPAGRALAAALAATLAACASAPLSRPLVTFPARDELARLAMAPAALPVPGDTLAVDGWQLSGPFPEQAGEQFWLPDGGDVALGKLIARGNGQLLWSAQLRCAARELGAFLLEKQQLPSRSLERFILGACGSLDAELRLLPLYGDAPASAEDDAVIAAWMKERAGDAEQLGHGMRDGGFWFGRKNGKAALVAVFAAPAARFAPFAPIPNAANELVLEGETLSPAGYVRGAVNQGSAGVKSCLADPAVALPRFRLSCPIDPNDATAWVEVAAGRSGEVLAKPLVDVLARRQASALSRYADTTQTASRRLASSDEFNRSIVELINQARRARGLSPVQAAPAQSAQTGALAGRYFADLLTPAANDEANTIALGLLAGWNVDGTLRDGTFFSDLTPGLDAGTWLREALERPSGRQTLLAPDLDRVAVAAAPGARSLGGIALGYRFARALTPEDLASLYGRITFARSRMSLAAPGRLKGIDAAIDSELAKVRAGDQSPEEALHAAVQRAALEFGGNVRGQVVEVSSLDELPIDKEILEQPKLHMAAGLSLHRPPGAAWAQYIAMIVYVDYSVVQQVARR